MSKRISVSRSCLKLVNLDRREIDIVALYESLGVWLSVPIIRPKVSRIKSGLSRSSLLLVTPEKLFGKFSRPFRIHVRSKGSLYMSLIIF